MSFTWIQSDFILIWSHRCIQLSTLAQRNILARGHNIWGNRKLHLDWRFRIPSSGSKLCREPVTGWVDRISGMHSYNHKFRTDMQHHYRAAQRSSDAPNTRRSTRTGGSVWLCHSGSGPEVTAVIVPLRWIRVSHHGRGGSVVIWRERSTNGVDLRAHILVVTINSVRILGDGPAFGGCVHLLQVMKPCILSIKSSWYIFDHVRLLERNHCAYTSASHC